MLTKLELELLITRCKYPGFEFHLKYDGGRPYMQIYCQNGIDNDTGKKVSWTGRKWMLSYHMVPNEVVNTAFKAVMAAIEHEARENFKYRNVAIMNPHIDPDKLVDFVSNHDNIQERQNALFAA